MADSPDPTQIRLPQSPERAGSTGTAVTRSRSPSPAPAAPASPVVAAHSEEDASEAATSTQVTYEDEDDDEEAGSATAAGLTETFLESSAVLSDDADATDDDDEDVSERDLGDPNESPISRTLRSVASRVRSAVHRASRITFPLAILPPIQPAPAPISNAPTLYVHRPRWPRQKNSWASSDPECLVWQTYLQFSGIKYDLVLCDEPLMSPTGALPFLVTEKGRVFASRDRLLRYIGTRAHAPATVAAVVADVARGARPADAARLLTPEDLPAAGDARALAHMYLALIDTALWPALMHNWWREPRNRPAMAALYTRGVYPRPVDALILESRAADVAKHLATRYGEDAAARSSEDVYAAAADALEAIAVRLGDSAYFFGDSPSFIDALLFATIHSILSADFPADKLRGLVIAHAKLFQYSKDIWNKWFRKYEMNVKPLRRCGVEVPVTVAGAASASPASPSA
ncbi:hypothetical protein H9P43_002187 [Blastocladiella emersonii ATCC 22665]|nr:hypothetical protein H9P43_002187 [Blastocladiella emersonii ATCC 22665]